MIRFEIASQDLSQGAGVSVRRAWCFSNGDAALPGVRVSIESGVLVAETPAGMPAGLCVEVAVPGEDGEGVAGVVAMRTSLLPPRERAYRLTVELARAKLMQAITRAEEWGTVALAGNDFDTRLESAKSLFARALALGSPESPEKKQEQERLAQRALGGAVAAGEMLARAHARARISLRASGVAGRTPANADREDTLDAGHVASPDGIGVYQPGLPNVGCIINPSVFSEPLAKAVTDASDTLCVPLRWSGLEPREGTYSFASTDRWIEWSVLKAKVPLTAGPVIDLRKICTPDWLAIWEHDYDTLREVVFEHVRQLVTRYRRTVPRWTVVSSIPNNELFTLTYDKMADLTRVCASAVRKLHPRARILVDIADPFGDRVASTKGAVAPVAYVQLLEQLQLDYDVIGLRVQMGGSSPCRDLMSLSEMLDLFAGFDKPVQVSAIGCPSRAGESDEGWIGERWTESRQASWLSDALSICAGKFFVQSIYWQDLVDGPASLECDSGGLLGVNGAPKPALAALLSFRQSLRATTKPESAS